LSPSNGIKKAKGFAAKLNERIKTYRTIGGNKLEFINPKHELLCSHSLRRSFATNAIASGFDTLSVMAMTGHKKESTFNNYVQLTQKEMASRLLKKSNEDERSDFLRKVI